MVMGWALKDQLVAQYASPALRRDLEAVKASQLECGRCELYFVYMAALSKSLSGPGNVASLRCVLNANIGRRSLHSVRPVPLIPSRDDLGALLESEGARVGLEVGVQTG
jgi:hypothetical protein